MTSVTTSAARTLEPLYTAIGVLALIVAWGGWRLRPWAYRLAWIFQGLVFAVGPRRHRGTDRRQAAPLGWLLLDTRVRRLQRLVASAARDQTRVRQTEGRTEPGQTEDERVSHWDQRASESPKGDR